MSLVNNINKEKPCIKYKSVYKTVKMTLLFTELLKDSVLTKFPLQSIAEEAIQYKIENDCRSICEYL